MNTSKTTSCPKCGAPLPADAPHGLCPRCLVAMNLTGASGVSGSGPVAAQPPPTIEQLAPLFPQLDLIACLGRGGMGVVYKARQPNLNRLVALKILAPERERDPAFAERFTHEARALAKLNHPNIVAIYDFGVTGGMFHLLMEFVDGMNLRELLNAGRVAPREALAIVPQICDALQYAHDAGIVHRDIKPENILLDRRGRVKVADFGLAKLAESDAAHTSAPADAAGRTPAEPSLTTAGQILGTPQYMAPEQAAHPADVDHRADIYSLGVVFYQMLTGELPKGDLTPPSSRMRGIAMDVRLDEVVMRALEKKPELRYQQVSNVKTMVETIAMTPPPQAAGPEMPADAAAYSEAVLSRDCPLRIGFCFRRGWTLVAQDFWHVVGVTLLIDFLVRMALGTVVGIVIYGPLMGGLWLYFLKRVRGERPVLDTAFSGFGTFKQLCLAGLVRTLLIAGGFLCLILPGIYLLVAWMFALPLVADRRLGFSQAMRLSRSVVNRQWWKFLAFGVVLIFIGWLGSLLCLVGGFVTDTIAMAALAYAYEDLFGMQPSVPPSPAAKGRRMGAAEKIILVAAAVLLAIMMLLFIRSHGYFGFNNRTRPVHGGHQAVAARNVSVSPPDGQHSAAHGAPSRRPDPSI